MQYHMVFDVESIGLHGEAFAVGYVVIDEDGNRIEERLYDCPSDAARGMLPNHKWIKEHVPQPDIDACTLHTPRQVRDEFWKQWLRWREKGAKLWADCAWPVEARFLIACIEDAPIGREWLGPYPLCEISTLMLMSGIDPLMVQERKYDELPEHNPLMDARQSARILHDLLCEKFPRYSVDADGTIARIIAGG